MSLYFCNQQESAGLLEHMESPEVKAALKSIPRIKDEVEEYEAAHKAVHDYFLHKDKQSKVFPEEFIKADALFDDLLRAFLFYFDYLVHLPKYAGVQSRFLALKARLFPLGRRTVRLSYAEEVAVAAQIHEIIQNDNEVKALIVGTDIPALSNELWKAGKALQTLLQKSVPTEQSKVSYRPLRTQWLNALGALQKRIELILEREVRKNKMTESKASELQKTLFTVVDEMAAKAARRRSARPDTGSVSAPNS
jgi:hypothetical protein